MSEGGVSEGGVIQLELELGDPAAGGGCVGHAPDGRVVFVRHALPGERVVARVTEEHARYLRADAVAVVAPSPDRVPAPCPHAGPGKCGGCDYQHASLEAQRRMKAHLVAEQLRRVAGVHHDVVVEEVVGAPEGLGWRTRVRFAVDGYGRTAFRRWHGHELEPVDRCLLATPEVEAAGAGARAWVGARSVEVVALDDPPGAVILVDGRPRTRPGRVAARVGGHRFTLSARGFWQVHRAAAATLTAAVLEALAPRPGDAVLDLYAGAGLFSLPLAEAVGEEGEVVAVERDRRSCSDATGNAGGRPQLRVLRADVTPELVTSRARGADLVVLDPPRSGAGIAVMRALAGSRRTRTIASVSCDAASFARDLRAVLDAGWRLGGLRVFDLFPMTEHVELVARLEAPPR